MKSAFIYVIILSLILPYFAQAAYCLASPGNSELVQSALAAGEQIENNPVVKDNIFENIWNADETIPIQERIRDYMAQMSWLFSRDEQDRQQEQEIAQWIKEVRFDSGDEAIRRLIVDYSHYSFNTLQTYFRETYVRVVNYGVPNVFFIPMFLAIFESVFVFMCVFLLQLHHLVRIVQDSAIAGHYAGNMYFFKKKMSLLIITHESLHWLKDKGIIATDLPITTMVSSYLDGIHKNFDMQILDKADSEKKLEKSVDEYFN